jgi:hypothetical protein
LFLTLLVLLRTPESNLFLRSRQKPEKEISSNILDYPIMVSSYSAPVVLVFFFVVVVVFPHSPLLDPKESLAERQQKKIADNSSDRKKNLVVEFGWKTIHFHFPVAVARVPVLPISFGDRISLNNWQGLLHSVQWTKININEKINFGKIKENSFDSLTCSFCMIISTTFDLFFGNSSFF